jgi:hypothetical protein
MRTDPNTPIFQDQFGGTYCSDHVGVAPSSRLKAKERFALIKAFGTTTLCETCRAEGVN